MGVRDLPEVGTRWRKRELHQYLQDIHGISKLKGRKGMVDYALESSLLHLPSVLRSDAFQTETGSAGAFAGDDPVPEDY